MSWIGWIFCMGLGMPSLPDATLVAKVKVHNASEETFSSAIVRGMLPLPRNYDGSVDRLALYDGQVPLPTQVSVFSTYPGSDIEHPVGKPEVVQLVTRTSLPPATFKELRVGRLDRPASVKAEASPGTAIAGWLESKAPLAVESVDVFGNRYRAEPITQASCIETRQSGPLLIERVYQATLVPVSPAVASKPAIREFLRVRAYVTLYADEEFASLTLLIYNGSLGRPNGDVYYRNLRVGIPSSLALTVWQKNFSPAAEASQLTRDGTLWQPCPPPLASEKVFAMPHGSAAVLRTSVHSQEASQRALQFMDHSPIFVPVPSQELFSWSNYSTARYDSVKYPMPMRLGEASLAKMEQTVRERIRSSTLGWDLVYLRQAPEGSSRTLGHAMPAGVAYGGMTGGSGIHYVFGAPAAITGHNGSVKLHVLLADRNFDRQRVHLFHDNGQPYVHGQHLTDSEGKKYLDLPYNHRGFPELKVADKSCAIHADHVKSRKLLSDQAQRLLKYMDHDDQHLSRVFDAVPAAYLACDPLNRDRLVALGTRACRRLNIYPIRDMPNFGGWGSLFNAKKHVDARPHSGVSITRAHGWLTHALGWAHDLSQNVQIREDCVEVAKIDVYMRSKAQMRDGNVSLRAPTAKALNGRYYFTTAWEEGAILANGARSVVSILSSPENSEHAATLQKIYTRVGRWLISKAWNPKAQAPGFFVCLREKGKEELLPTPITEGNAAFYMGTPLAWYYELTGEKVFLDRLRQMAGTKTLEERSIQEIGNWSYSLWLAQGGKITGDEGD